MRCDDQSDLIPESSFFNLHFNTHQPMMKGVKQTVLGCKKPKNPIWHITHQRSSVQVSEVTLLQESKHQD